MRRPRTRTLSVVAIVAACFAAGVALAVVNADDDSTFDCVMETHHDPSDGSLSSMPVCEGPT